MPAVNERQFCCLEKSITKTKTLFKYYRQKRIETGKKCDKIERRKKLKERNISYFKKTLVVLMAMIMVFTYMPGMAWAEETAEIAEVTVRAQSEGAFLSGFNQPLNVPANAAENMGYSDSVSAGVSALDALVEVHKKIFGESFTTASKDDFLAISPAGYVTKIFGKETVANGFMLNQGYPNSGPGTGIGYKGTTVDTQKVVSGDVLDFFIYQDQAMCSDMYTLVDAPEKAVTNSTITATVKGVSAMYGYFYGTPEELANAASPLKDMPLVWIDAETGAATEIKDVITGEDGKATVEAPANAGTYYLSAKSSSTTYSIMTPAQIMAVEPKKAEGIVISSEDAYPVMLGNQEYNYILTGSKNDTFKLNAVVTPEEASQEVIWSCNNSNFAVDEDGLVTVKKEFSSTAYVTFTAKAKSDESIKAEFTSYILPPLQILPQYQNMVLAIPEDGIVKNGGEYILVTPQDYQQKGFAKWTVWDDSIVRIDDKSNSNVCYLYPEKAGTTTVAVVDINGNAAKAKISVKGFFVKDASGKSGKGECQVGEKYQLTAETKDEVTWTSSNETVATVDENGLVSTLKVGVVKLTATSEKGKCSYELVVKKSDEMYLEHLWTTSTYSLYTDESMKENLSSEQKLINEGDSYTTSGHFFDITQKVFPVLYAKQGTSNATVSFGAKFDSSNYKAEVIQDGAVIKTFESGKTQSITIKAGTNKFAIRLTSLKNKKQFTDYEFTIERELSTDENLASLGLAPELRRAATLTKYRGQAEATLFRADENGEISTGTGFTASVYNYRAFVYSDVEKYVASIKTTNAVNGHFTYSFNDGKDWVDAECSNSAAVSLAPQTLAGNKGKLMVKVASDSSYAKSKAEGKDPYENSKIYSVYIERISADELAGLKLLSMDYSEGCKVATPSFNPDAPWAAATVARDTNKVTLTFTAPTGSNVFKASISESNKLKPTSTKDGVDTYTLEVATTLTSSTKSYSQKIILAKYDEDNKVIGQNEYTITLLKIGTTAGLVQGLPDEIKGYLCPGSQYSVNGQAMYGGYGIFPEKSLQGGASWNTAISLGNFGGYITYYYKDGIKDEPTHKYGIDFTVFGNSNGGASFSEPGAVYVSEDGKTWYALAGSEHYEDTTAWDYQVTYINRGGLTADYRDNLGNSGTLGAAYAPLLFPEAKIYPTAKENYSEDQNEVTVSGVRLYSPSTISKTGVGIERTATAQYPAFGYSDVHKNSSMVGSSGEGVTLLTAPVGNPYVKDYENFGDGFDLQWAVDETGMPVDVSGKEFHYVRIQTASFINGGIFGEKSTEVNGIVKTEKGNADVGISSMPKAIEISNGNTIKTVEIEKEKQVYEVNLNGMKYVSIAVKEAAEDANIYVNNQRLEEGKAASGIKVTKDSEKLVRVIVQNGESAPVIYMLKLNSDADNAIIDGIKAEINGSITLAQTTDGENYTMTVSNNADEAGLLVSVAESTKLTVNGEEFKNGDKVELVTGKNEFVIEAINKEGAQTVKLVIIKQKPYTGTDGGKVSFTLRGDVVHDSDTDGEKHTLKRDNLPTWIQEREYDIQTGTTVLDVFSKALKANSYTWVNAGGNYISSITTPEGIELAEFTNGQDSGWMYTLNGRHPNLGVAEQVVKNGDKIVFHYTDAYKEEEGSEKWNIPSGTVEEVKDVTSDTKAGTTTAPTEVTVTEKTNADGTKTKVAEVKVSDDNQKEILKQAKEKKSNEIILVVSSKAAGDATKADVTLDKIFIDSIVKDTDAKLTIRTPFGDKTYTQEELKALSEAAVSQTITVAIEKAEEPADDAANIAKAKSIVKDMKLVARSSKTAKRNIKAVLKSDAKVKASIKELKDLGFTVKYRFYRSTKKSASYKSTVTKNTAVYTNTSGKMGTKYFYKVQMRVYDENGKLVAKTALKQCKYAARTWSK